MNSCLGRLKALALGGAVRVLLGRAERSECFGVSPFE